MSEIKLPETMYLLFSSSTWGAIPFLNTKGCPFVYSTEADANKGAEQAMAAGCKGISVHPFSQEQLKGNLAYWAACGIQALYYVEEGKEEGKYIPIRVNLTREDGTTVPVAAGYYVNAGLTDLMISYVQHKNSDDNDGTAKTIKPIFQAMLHNGLYLLPMAYEGEPAEDHSDDKMFHALKHVPELIKAMIAEEKINMKSRDEIRFYGADTFTWAEKADPRRLALFDAVSKSTKERRLVAFTDAFTLRRMYPKARIVVATLFDLKEHLDKNKNVLTGLTINPGTINCNLSPEEVTEIIELKEEDITGAITK